MVKTIQSFTNSGVHDWIWQRVSAVVVAVYAIFILAFLLGHTIGASNHLTYLDWSGLFSMLWMKIATVIFVLALIIHAWIGTWTILTDYVHNAIVRNVLLYAFIAGYLIYLIWTINILWR